MTRTSGYARFVDRDDPALAQVVMAAMGRGGFSGEMSAAADYMGPGAIEVNRYQTEITDMVKRRLPFGQRINQTPATGQPSRYFEQLTINSAAFSDPRILTATAGQPQRVERALTLKALTSQINYGLFDVEVTQQQGQMAYLEAKDLTDTVDGVLKLHDQNLWNGTDTDLYVASTTQYYGVSGQLFAGAAAAGGLGVTSIASSGSLVDSVKAKIAAMAARTDYEMKPSGLYTNPLMLDLFDREAKTFQLYYNQVEILPGVIVEGIPTQMGVLPLIGDPSITNFTGNGVPVGQALYTMFIISEDMVEYHYLTDPLPRVFQLGLLSNLAAQYVVVKFGAPVAKGAPYAHAVLTAQR